MASEEDNQHNDVVAIELPAPAGWSKKFTPKKGGTPQRNDIVFVSPTGEEIKSKRQLEQYLKSHPEGPSASEFDWGTGDTPRRSSRLSEKMKAVAVPTSQSPKKKQKRSGTKGAREKTNADADEEAVGEKDAPAEDVIPEKPDCEDVEKKADAEEPPAAASADTEESKDTTTAVVPDVQVQESKEAPSIVPGAQMEESKETPSVVPDPKADDLKEAPGAENDKGKEGIGADKEAPDGKVETVVTAVEEKEEPLLQEPPKAGS